MTALITLSHGSRHPRAAEGVRALTAAAAARLEVDAVESHLDFTAPTLPEAAGVLADAGHTDAVVVPLLFTDAYHARVDVPQALDDAQRASGLTLRLAGTLGLGEDVARVLAARVALDAPADAAVVLYPVGTSDALATENIARCAARVGELSGQRTVVVPATGRGESTGIAGLRAVAETTPRMHLLPLFVTHGTLLDDALAAVGGLQDSTGVAATHSAPLVRDLTPIVARRYREAVPQLSRTGG